MTDPHYQLQETPRNCCSPAGLRHESATHKHRREWNQISRTTELLYVGMQKESFQQKCTTGTHHGTALRCELREATGLDVGPAPPEHKAHGVHRQPPPTLPPGVRCVPSKRRLPAPPGNKYFDKPTQQRHWSRRAHRGCRSNKRRKATPNRNCNFRNPGGPGAENARITLKLPEASLRRHAISGPNRGKRVRIRGMEHDFEEGAHLIEDERPLEPAFCSRGRR
jgi:hypothetical protein